MLSNILGVGGFDSPLMYAWHGFFAIGDTRNVTARNPSYRSRSWQTTSLLSQLARESGQAVRRTNRLFGIDTGAVTLSRANRSITGTE